MNLQALLPVVPLAPLVGAALAGFFGKNIGRTGAHCVTILGVAVALCLSLLTFWEMNGGAESINTNLYTWMTVGGIDFNIGFLVDPLTAMMMVVVTSVSLMVHIYTIGYMHEDPGYQRFFSYISLFTFAMLMLVMSNNFVQLFFGWEAVGLVSYLLIGFWFKKPSAIFANLKAFLINRVGDFGFVLGIGLVFAYTNSMDYAEVFNQVNGLSHASISLIPGHTWSWATVTCILLFVGAMGKSAQFPLHVWLPDSMEGPTPISALIHAATMVTAGIFMVSRMSPLFELSDTALSVVLISGAITAFFMAFLGMIQHDIKRVVAYSTLSQLGYMTVALGASAYTAASFHLMTHAFFKALLFLGAGSVIVAMHHEQDMRKMGGLKKYLPITYWTSLVGSLALAGIPPFAGFFSKDKIIEAVQLSHLPGSGFAQFAVMSGVFLTAFYSFRMLFLTFHGAERMDHHTKEHLHEPGWVITLPLALLAVPSAIIGLLMIEPMLFGKFFGHAIVTLPSHPAMLEMAHEWHGPLAMMQHALTSPVLWLAVAGIASAYVCYMVKPEIPGQVVRRLGPVMRVLERKYYLDDVYIHGFAGGGRILGTAFWRVGEQGLIDGTVNRVALWVRQCAGWMRGLQSGFVYHYAFAMIIGVIFAMAYLMKQMGLWH